MLHLNFKLPKAAKKVQVPSTTPVNWEIVRRFSLRKKTVLSKSFRESYDHRLWLYSKQLEDVGGDQKHIHSLPNEYVWATKYVLVIVTLSSDTFFRVRTITEKFHLYFLDIQSVWIYRNSPEIFWIYEFYAYYKDDVFGFFFNVVL